jgi:condensin-2 complex subunit G2
MLLQCTMQPLYLCSPEGGKFLSFIFGLHPVFIEDIHDTVLSHLQCSKKSVAQAYGGVYFRAWKESSGQYLMKIEEGCVQDFINKAVHASKPAIFTAVRHVLNEFHKNKKVTHDNTRIDTHA